MEWSSFKASIVSARDAPVEAVEQRVIAAFQLPRAGHHQRGLAGEPVDRSGQRRVRRGRRRVQLDWRSSRSARSRERRAFFAALTHASLGGSRTSPISHGPGHPHCPDPAREGGVRRRTYAGYARPSSIPARKTPRVGDCAPTRGRIFRSRCCASGPDRSSLCQAANVARLTTFWTPARVRQRCGLAWVRAARPRCPR